MKKLLPIMMVLVFATTIFAQDVPISVTLGTPNSQSETTISNPVNNWTGLGTAPVISGDAHINTVPIAVPKPMQASSAVILSKFPDLGTWWHDVSTSGTYVYANSFLSLGDGTPTELGMWLRLFYGTTVPSIRFEIWGDNGGAPDPTNILATTGSISPAVTATLTLYSAPVLSGASNLTTSSMYWYVITCVGEPSADGGLQVGGHTRNSVYSDNGTFWYSNDPTGIIFDGIRQTPEMAFEVTIGPPPVPISNWALGIGLLLISGFIVVRYRRRLA